MTLDMRLTARRVKRSDLKIFIKTMPVDFDAAEP